MTMPRTVRGGRSCRDAADTIGRRERQLERLLSNHEELLVEVIRRTLELASTSIILIHTIRQAFCSQARGTFA